MSIQAINLSRVFGTKHALHPCDFSLPPGSATLLLGPNGAGKSTLIGLITGLLPATTGSALLSGQNARIPSSRATLGACVAGALPPRRTLRQLLHGEVPPLSVPLDQRLCTLSSGQHQRAKLSLALRGTPAILVLDEPLTFLDQRGMQEVRELIYARWTHGTTTLIATHRPEDWSALTPSILTLEAGRLSCSC